MVLKLKNYNNEIAEAEIGNLDEILTIGISVVSGDEIAMVVYETGGFRNFDSARILNKPRFTDYEDCAYVIYCKGYMNRIEEWNKRKDSDSFS